MAVYPTRVQIEAIITANKGAGKSMIRTKIEEYCRDVFPSLKDEELSRIVNDLESYSEYAKEI